MIYEDKPIVHKFADILREEQRDNDYLAEIFISTVESYVNQNKTLWMYTLLDDMLKKIDMSTLSQNKLCQIQTEYLEHLTRDRIIDIVGEHGLVGLARISLRQYLENLLDKNSLYGDLFKKLAMKQLKQLSPNINDKYLKSVVDDMAFGLSRGTHIKPSDFVIKDYSGIVAQCILSRSSYELGSPYGYRIIYKDDNYVVVNNKDVQSEEQSIMFNFTNVSTAQSMVDMLNECKVSLKDVKAATEKKKVPTHLLTKK